MTTPSGYWECPDCGSLTVHLVGTCPDCGYRHKEKCLGTEISKLETELAECRKENERLRVENDSLHNYWMPTTKQNEKLYQKYKAENARLKKQVEELEKELNRDAVCDKCSELKVNCICEHGILKRGNS